MTEGLVLSILRVGLIALPLFWLLPRLPLAPRLKVAVLRLGLAACIGALIPLPVSGVEIPDAVRGGPSPNWSLLMSFLAGIWLLGFVMALGRTAWAHAAFCRSLGRLEMPDEVVQSRVARLASQLGAPQPKVRISAVLGSPLVLPGLPQVLALGSQPVSDSVLLHELAHVAGRDTWWLAAARFVEALIWFNPLGGRYAEAIALAQETRADAAAAGADVQGYARELVESAAAFQSNLASPFTGPSGEIAERLRSLKIPPRTAWWAVIAAPTLLAAALFTRASLVEEPEMARPISVRPAAESLYFSNRAPFEGQEVQQGNGSN